MHDVPAWIFVRKSSIFYLQKQAPLRDEIGISNQSGGYYLHLSLFAGNFIHGKGLYGMRWRLEANRGKFLSVHAQVDTNHDWKRVNTPFSKANRTWFAQPAPAIFPLALPLSWFDKDPFDRLLCSLSHSLWDKSLIQKSLRFSRIQETILTRLQVRPELGPSSAVAGYWALCRVRGVPETGVPIHAPGMQIESPLHDCD